MESNLNPLAPEFNPKLGASVENSYTAVSVTIQVSNNWVSGSSHQVFKRHGDFNAVVAKLSQNLISVSDEIVSTEFPMARFRRCDHTYNLERVIDFNDTVLDRTTSNMQLIRGVTESGAELPNVSVPSVSRSNSPVIAASQLGTASLMVAKNIPRPQLSFKDKIDNSASLFLPKLTEKLNCTEPLCLKLLYTNAGEPIGYEHPYQIEIDTYRPPFKFLVANTNLEYPSPLENTQLHFVETERQMDSMIAHLQQYDEIAVDLEHHSYRSYQGITCLIQLSTIDADFIVDALAAREHVQKLNLIFTDPRILKVFHGANNDVLWLQRDFGVYLVGLFDTYQASVILRFESKSLKYLMWKYCQIKVDKKYQLADWRIRPLPEELVKYARMDTHYLIYIWRCMQNDLLNAANGDITQLKTAFSSSRICCLLTYNKVITHEESHLEMYYKTRKNFNNRQMTALKLLFKWRDDTARLLDESPSYVMPDHMLLSLSETLPRDNQGVTACCNPMPPVVLQHMDQIHRLLASCRELPLVPLLPSAQALAVPARAPSPVCVHDLCRILADSESEPDAEVIKSSGPDITAFETSCSALELLLNAESQLYIPPFFRFQNYRALAQAEEIKELKDKEAKISAISKGDPLIKQEVLDKLQAKRSEVTHAGLENDSSHGKELIHNAAQRKRKLSEKDKKDATANKPKDKNSTDVKVKNANSAISSNFNSFNYKNRDYSKFSKKNDTHAKHAKTTNKKRSFNAKH